MVQDQLTLSFNKSRHGWSWLRSIAFSAIFRSKVRWFVLVPFLILMKYRIANGSDRVTAKLDDRRLSFSHSSFSCMWIPDELSWDCGIFLNGGRITNTPPLLPTPYSGDLHFEAAGSAVQKLSDLEGHTYAGHAAIFTGDGFSWNIRSATQIEIKTIDLSNNTVKFKFNGTAVYLTKLHLRGIILPYCGEGLARVTTSSTNKALMLSATKRSGMPSLILEELLSRANRNDHEAQYSLGNVYATGKAVKQSWNEAFEWWEKSAFSGHPEAQAAYSLKFLPQDPVRAYQWCYLASKGGSVRGRRECQRLKSQLSPDQLDRAVRMADTWLSGVDRSSEQGIEPHDIEKLQKEADNGNAEAEYKLAEAFLYGRGISVDVNNGLDLLAAAAEDGSGQALREYPAMLSLAKNTIDPPITYSKYRYMKLAEAKGTPGAHDEIIEMGRIGGVRQRTVWYVDYLEWRLWRFIRSSRALLWGWSIHMKQMMHWSGADAEAYCARLLSPNHGIRRKATRDLMHLGIADKQSLVPCLANAIWDMDEERSLRAFKALKWIAPQVPEMANEVVRVLKLRKFWMIHFGSYTSWSNDLLTRRVQEVLQRMGPPAESALSAMAHVSNKEQASLAESTLQRLANAKQDEITPAIEERYYSPLTDFKDVNAWIQLVPVVVPIYLKNVNDSDHDKQREAILALGEFGETAYREVPSVAECLQNTVPTRCRGTKSQFEEVEKWRQTAIQELAPRLKNNDPLLVRQVKFAVQKLTTRETPKN